ncbi:arsenate reductase [Escherichia coli]|nr:arsenate reductase [Escherichia coli]
MSNITIYHNPACGTSRNTLEMIRNSGTEPTIIYYLETPPTRDELVKLIADMGITVRALLRKNVEPYEELGLAEDKFTHDQLIDFMLQHPILINRPIVVTPLGTRLCRLQKSCWKFCQMRKKARSPRKMARKWLMRRVIA